MICQANLYFFFLQSLRRYARSGRPARRRRRTSVRPTRSVSDRRRKLPSRLLLRMVGLILKLMGHPLRRTRSLVRSPYPRLATNQPSILRLHREMYLSSPSPIIKTTSTLITLLLTRHTRNLIKASTANVSTDHWTERLRHVHQTTIADMTKKLMADSLQATNAGMNYIY